MKLPYITGMLLMLMVAQGAAQSDTARSKYGNYYFEGDEVVFEFDVRAYASVLRSVDSTLADFADLDVLEIAVSGDFNNWSEDGWKMQKAGPFLFRLRKPVLDFKDAPNWQFKFLVSRIQQIAADSMLKKKGMLGWYDIPNPNVPVPVPVDSGNVLFRLDGHTESKQVILTGTFNNWDENALKMKRNNGGWELRLMLTPGVYEYKFIADGTWMHDPANPEKRRNQYSTINSVLRVTQSVRFELHGFNDARSVVLSGNFNNWNTSALKMRRTEIGWATEVPLTTGKYLYKFIVDGNWITDPANPRTETTREGHTNSVLLLR